VPWLLLFDEELFDRRCLLFGGDEIRLLLDRCDWWCRWRWWRPPLLVDAVAPTPAAGCVSPPSESELLLSDELLEASMMLVGVFSFW